MSKEAVHWRLLPLQASACKLCCRAIPAGAAEPVGKAELWHGPGELCGGAAEGLCSLELLWQLVCA